MYDNILFISVLFPFQKPAGGVPLFGQSGVLAGLKAKMPQRHSSSSESDSSAHEPHEEISNALPKFQQLPSFGNQPVNASENVDDMPNSSIGSFQRR